MSSFVVRAGDTETLVTADDEADARRRFLVAVPRGQVLAGATAAVSVRVATESDLTAFRRRRARPPETLKLALDDRKAH